MQGFKNKFDMKKVISGAGIFFVRRRQWAVALVAVGLLVYAGFLWYTFIINPQWSDSKKQEYISTKTNEAVFNQKRFDSAIAEINKRKGEFNNDFSGVPDIFNLK